MTFLAEVLMNIALSLLLLLSFLAFAGKRLLIYLHALQQDDYNNERLFAWIKKHKVFDIKLSCGLLALGILAFLLPAFLTALAVIGVRGYRLFRSRPRTRSKKSWS